MERIAIVSSADHKYHHLLIELISSVRRHGPPGRFAICVLDAGMTPEQVSRLAPLVDEISQCRWEFELPARRVRGRESLKANLCRPFIPDYFPGYDVYVWLDADTWVADWEAIDLYVTGAARMALAITAQTDRAYQDPVRVSWFLGIPFRVKTFYYSNARRAFGRRLARSLIGCNVLNAGAFALRRDAPHWAAWKRLMADALVKGRPFTADQLTLGLLVYREGAAVEILPAWCNWLAEMTPPAFAPDLGQFVEPYLPHHRIGVMHLAGLPAMRSDRAVTMEVRRVGGGTERRSLRYPDPIVVDEGVE
jgi:hypothetical protein